MTPSSTIPRSSTPKRSRWRKILEQFQDPLIYLLFAAIVISLLAWVIEGCGRLAVRRRRDRGHRRAQRRPRLRAQATAERAVEALQRMSATTATVARDGAPLQVPTRPRAPPDRQRAGVLEDGLALTCQRRLGHLEGRGREQSLVLEPSFDGSGPVDDEPAPVAAVTERLDLVVLGGAEVPVAVDERAPCPPETEPPFVDVDPFVARAQMATMLVEALRWSTGEPVQATTRGYFSSSAASPLEPPATARMMVPRVEGTMKISVVVASRPDVAPREDLAVAGVADRLGFAELWIGEGWVWDAFVLATAIAARTDRISMTVGPIPVSVRDPVMIARAAASTAAVAGRPVGVALGTSSVRYVEGAHGRSRRRPVTALSESAQVVRALFRGESVDFDGDVISTHGYGLRLDPPGGPITVAAFGDRAIEVAATYADRMVLDLVSPEMAAVFRSRLDAAAVRAARPAPRLAAWIPAAVDPDPASYEQITWSLVRYLGVAGYAEMFQAAGFEAAVELAAAGAGRQELRDALPSDAAHRIGLVGDAAAVRARLAAYASAGLDEVAVLPATSGDPAGERTLTALASLG